MPRKPSQGLTERESEIMDILWEAKEASSDQIRQQLSGEPHDSSVRTLLRILIEKGFVQADSSVRPTKYLPAIKREKAQKSAAKQLLHRMFGGSAETLVLRLLEDKQLTLEQLNELQQNLPKSKRGKRK